MSDSALVQALAEFEFDPLGQRSFPSLHSTTASERAQLLIA